MSLVHVGLGANLPGRGPSVDRLETLRAAVRALAGLGEVVSRSSVWETDPIGPPPKYLNAAVALRTGLAPEVLLAGLLGIEAAHGRVRTGERNGPRTLDLDILLVEDRVIDTPTLQVPHPRLAERAFALAPLAEIAPDAVHPLLHCSIRELVARLAPLEGVRRLDEPL